MANEKTGGLQTVVWRLAFILGFGAVLYLGKGFLIPLMVAALLALMLDPLQRWLQEKGWTAGWAVTACMLSLLLFFGILTAVVSTQAVRFVQDWPEIKKNIDRKTSELESTLGDFPGFSAPADSSSTGGSANSGSSLPVSGQAVRSTASNLLGILSNFLLMLVYVAILLLSKNRLFQFAIRRSPPDKEDQVAESIIRARKVAVGYLKGRLILIGILSVCYTIGFLIFGIKYAILLAVLTAFLSIIPYLGNIIGGGIAILITFANGGDTTQLLAIVGTIALIQPLESYVLTPLIFKDQVEINPLTTIVGVVGFGLIWGTVGAIVAIPLIAMVRVFCSEFDGLKDYAFLLGTDKE